MMVQVDPARSGPDPEPRGLRRTSSRPGQLFWSISPAKSGFLPQILNWKATAQSQGKEGEISKGFLSLFFVISSANQAPSVSIGFSNPLGRQ